MLLTIDPIALPDTFAPTVPTHFHDADALATWLNTLVPDITGQYWTEGRRWPWEGDLNNNEYQLAIWCETAQDAAQVEGLAGYFFAGPLAMGGEWALLGSPGWAEATGRLFVFDCDLTKSQRDDIGDVL